MSGELRVPNIVTSSCPEDEALFQHRLITLGGNYNLTHPVNHQRTLSVWLHVTDACNLNCFYCYIPELKKRVDPNLQSSKRLNVTDSQSVHIADGLVAYCNHNDIKSLQIRFAGGEPTMALDEIEHFCNYLRSVSRSIKLSFGMLSNGYFDIDRVLPMLKRNKVGISFSIDGLEAGHDRIRYVSTRSGRVGTWKTIVQNALALDQSGIRPYFLYTIAKKNIDELSQFAKFAHQNGFGFRLSLERGKRAIEYSEQKRVSDYLINFYEQLAYFAPTSLRLDRDAKFAEWNLNKPKRTACSSCRESIAIRRDGQVASCQMRFDEPSGNVTEQPLDHAFSKFSEDGRTRQLSHPSEKVGACSLCKFGLTCAGGCPQHTRDVKGTIDTSSPWCFTYGSLFPSYVHSNALHLGRRAATLLQ